MLTNLVGNALKFTHRGSVVITLQTDSVGPAGATVRFTVQDTGVGIREIDQPMICTPFFRGESPLKEGRYGGLNLAITKMLVALHGGQLWFESVEGQGSTFSFNLPIAE